MTTGIRWMIRRDTPEVMAIERASFEHSWAEEDLIRCLRQRNCIGMVLEHDESIVGFMIYELHKNTINVINFAVKPEFRRQGFGKMMIDKLISKLSAIRRTSIVFEVRDTLLDAQLFLRSCGFVATSVSRQHYLHQDETDFSDAYIMKYIIKDDLVPDNRNYSYG